MTRNLWRRRWPVLAFGWDSRRKHAIFVLLAFGLATAAALRYGSKGWDGVWTFGDRVVTIVTLAVAIAVWFGEIREEWERRLPRKLFAFFLFNEQPVAVCLGAALSGEHDARQLGQQIGLQMCPREERFLAFDCSQIQQRDLRNVVTKAGNNDSFKPILIVFRLTNEDQVTKFGVEKGTALLWVAGQDEKLKVVTTDPRCQLPLDRLSDRMIADLR